MTSLISFAESTFCLLTTTILLNPPSTDIKSLIEYSSCWYTATIDFISSENLCDEELLKSVVCFALVVVGVKECCYEICLCFVVYSFSPNLGRNSEGDSSKIVKSC